VSAQEADRRRIGKDRLLGEGERREKYTEIATELLLNVRKKSRKGNGRLKRGLESPPVPGRKKKA